MEGHLPSETQRSSGNLREIALAPMSALLFSQVPLVAPLAVGGGAVLGRFAVSPDCPELFAFHQSHLGGRVRHHPGQVGQDLVEHGVEIERAVDGGGGGPQGLGQLALLALLAQAPWRLVVADRRITRLPPRYDGYWGKAERFARNYRPYSPSGLFPAPLLDKLDRVPGLARAYDDGDIQVGDRVAIVYDRNGVAKAVRDTGYRRD